MRRFLLLILVTITACSSPAAAPIPAATETTCSPDFCIDHPGDWTAEVGDGFISLSHETEPAAVATVGFIDMRAVAEAGSRFWPATPETVARAFWELLDDLGSADLDELEALEDGSIRTNGNLDGGRLWHRLVPFDGPTGVGVEVRAPSDKWSQHADVILDGLVTVADFAP